jgi:hypothetical protein
MTKQSLAYIKSRYMLHSLPQPSPGAESVISLPYIIPACNSGQPNLEESGEAGVLLTRLVHSWILRIIDN